MALFLTYELKVAILIAVFYIFWRLLVANETWHRLNRIVLLSTAVASFVLPLCVITIHQTVEVTPSATEPMPISSTLEEPLVSQEAMPALTAEKAEQPFDWQLLITIIYIIGVLVVLSKMVLSLWRLHKMIAESEIHPLSDGRQIAVCETAKTPFSWWKTVFLNHQDFEEGTTALLTHELGHIRLHHSADVLLVELLTALQWFNPAMWMLRADLRTIHEYEADQQVLSHGFNDIQYLQLLIRKAASQSGYSLANGISNSALKKRVTMIMKPKSIHRQWLRYAYLLPIVAVSLAMSAKVQKEEVTKSDSSIITTDDSAIILGQKNGRECIGVKAPVGAFFSWLVNGQLAERGDVKEDGRWNVRQYYNLDDYVIKLDGKEISKDNIPQVPISSIKELKYLQGEKPRVIELYTKYVSGYNRTENIKWPEQYQDQIKRWMFFKVVDAATGKQLSGAEVTVAETGQKALTNAEGWCELKIALGTTVKASYQGLEPQNVKIDKMSGNEILGHTFWMNKPEECIYIDKDVDSKPVFSGNKEKWFAEHAKLSESARKEGVHSVTVWAVINEDGSVSGVRLMQGVRKELNDEAIRLVSSMPRWQAATKDGKKVKCLSLVRVNFA